jgi:RNA-directed DNA polymerase
MRGLAITNRRHFLSTLGIKNEELLEVLSDTARYYKPYIKKEIKKDGSIKERAICPSAGSLKLIQDRMVRRIFSKYRFPKYIQGGIRGSDSITNAKPHQGKPFHFCLDIKNFFPSIKNTRINKVLLKVGYTPDVAHLIAKLVTCTKTTVLVTLKREVPQGASTSTFITNLTFYQEVDIQIERIIKEKGITYTRYVDDLNFSSQKDFIREAYEIVQVVCRANFKISRKKTFYKKGKVEVTGTQVCQNALKPTNKLLSKLNESERSDASKIGIRNHIERIKSFKAKPSPRSR